MSILFAILVIFANFLFRLFFNFGSWRREFEKTWEELKVRNRN